MKKINVIDEAARALSFLTILPIPDRFFKNVTNESSAQCAGLYPVAGAIIGLLSGTILFLAHILGLPAIISATLAVFTMIALTGALHEDGLGDIADGFGGGSSIEKRLEIMKDSRLGTYGVIAVSGSLLLRTVALSSILNINGLVGAICALIAVTATSRGAMVWMWCALPNARNNGVSSTIGTPPESALSLSTILALTFAAIFGISAAGFVPASIAIGFAVLTLFGFKKLCTTMIGGQTGDALGACQQLVEISMLVGLAIIFAPTN